MNHYFRYYFSLLFHIYLSFHSSHYIPVQLFVHLIVIKITYIYNIPNFLHVCFLQPVNSKQNYLAIQKSEKHRYGGNWRPPFCLLPVCAFRYPHTRTRKYLWTHRLNRPYSRMYHLPSPFPLHFPFISSSLFFLSLSLTSLWIILGTDPRIRDPLYCTASHPCRRCFCREHSTVDRVVYDIQIWPPCFWEPAITIHIPFHGDWNNSRDRRDLK